MRTGPSGGDAVVGDVWVFRHVVGGPDKGRIEKNAEGVRRDLNMSVYTCVGMDSTHRILNISISQLRDAVHVVF